MPPPLHVRDDAAADIDEAYTWYDTRSTGVGDQFLSEVRRALTALEGAPLRYPIIRDPVRRILLRTFPYGLFYIADSDHTVVIACSHFRQSPRHWFRRSS